MTCKKLKIVSDTTYNVFSGTSNLAQSQSIQLSDRHLHSLLLSGNKCDRLETFNTISRMVSIHSWLLYDNLTEDKKYSF